MENIDKMINIYKSLSNCTTHEEIESFKIKLKGPSCSRVPNASGESSVKKRRTEERECFGKSQRENNESTNMEQMPRGSRMSALEKIQKDVDKLIEEAKELVAGAGFNEGGLTLEVPYERAIRLEAIDYVGCTFEINMYKIWQYLTRSEVTTIGVWGMGGVGKTTLVEHIHNKILKNMRLLGSPYWVTVSKDCTLHKLQSDIAKRVDKHLFEDLSNEDHEPIRAGKLAQYFENKERFVLLLDDMWNHFDLKRVGIPKKNRCKVILTTRELTVCHKMVCDEIIKVEPLREEEAWNLFVKSTGYGIPPRVEEIAKQVAIECAGLPLGITVLAKSMAKSYDIGEWKNVLKKLQSSKVGKADMENYVFKVLRLSFDRLNDVKLQECLLHCATYPEDWHIPNDELIWAFHDYGLIDEMVSMEQVINEGREILIMLQQACLLSKSTLMDDCFKMHDLTRDMALQIAGSRFMVKAGIGLQDCPSEEEWNENMEVVSLMGNKIQEIQISPSCPKLSILLLQSDFVLRRIRDSFFDQLFGLTVLNLSRSGIEFLPSSISNLKNLAVLLLARCGRLTHVPSLSELKALKKLDLYRTGVIDVPEGLENLINLRYLNLKSKNLKTLPVEVFRKLIRLQYLVVYWDSSEAVKVSGHELMNVRKLERFEGGLYDIDDLNELVKLKEKYGLVTMYVFQVGSNGDFLFNYKVPCRYVGLHKCSTSTTKGNILKLPKDIQHLEIKDCHIRNLSEGLNNATELETLFIYYCKGIVSGLCQYPFCFPLATFSKLERLYIYECPNIKKLLSPILLPNLQKLKVISIQKCDELEEIIESPSEEAAGTHLFALPNLSRFEVFDLPKLKRICSGNVVLSCASPMFLFIRCGKLRRIPFAFPSLCNEKQPSSSSCRGRIQVVVAVEEKEWWESLEWIHPEDKVLLHVHYSKARDFTRKNWQGRLNRFRDPKRTIFKPSTSAGDMPEVRLLHQIFQSLMDRNEELEVMSLPRDSSTPQKKSKG